jgi:hypothetical protein
LGVLSVLRFKDQIIKSLGNPLDSHGKDGDLESYFYNGFTLYFKNSVLSGISIKRFYLNEKSENDFVKVGILAIVLKKIFTLSVSQIKDLCINYGVTLARKVYSFAPDELNLLINQNFTFCFDENNEIEMIEFIFENDNSDLYYLENF